MLHTPCSGTASCTRPSYSPTRAGSPLSPWAAGVLGPRGAVPTPLGHQPDGVASLARARARSPAGLRLRRGVRVRARPDPRRPRTDSSDMTWGIDLPDGTAVRGGGLREPQPAGPEPEFGLYLTRPRGWEPGWPAAWVDW